MNTILAAEAFATAAHVNQKRKYTGEPYIVHPREVFFLLLNKPLTKISVEALAAAWLHDVVEDTPITIEEIERFFGKEIASLVGWVTDVSKPSDGNRKKRKQLDLEHIVSAPAEAQDIKLADVIENTSSIVQYDPHFSKVYLKEKKDLLDAIEKENKDYDRHLMNMARKII